MSNQLDRLICSRCLIIAMLGFLFNHFALAVAVIKIDNAKYEDNKLSVKSEFKGDFPEPDTVKHL